MLMTNYYVVVLCCQIAENGQCSDYEEIRTQEKSYQAPGVKAVQDLMHDGQHPERKWFDIRRQTESMEDCWQHIQK